MKYVDLGEAHHDAEDSVWDPTSEDGRTFRRRFGIPYQLFDVLCHEYEDVEQRARRDAIGRPQSDSRLLILGVLCVLTQHLPFELIEELNGISKDENNKFFKEFVHWVAKKKFPDVVKLPSSEPEIQNVEGYYRSIG